MHPERKTQRENLRRLMQSGKKTRQPFVMNSISSLAEKKVAMKKYSQRDNLVV